MYVMYDTGYMYVCTHRTYTEHTLDTCTPHIGNISVVELPQHVSPKILFQPRSNNNYTTMLNCCHIRHNQFIGYRVVIRFGERTIVFCLPPLNKPGPLFNIVIPTPLVTRSRGIGWIIHLIRPIVVFWPPNHWCLSILVYPLCQRCFVHLIDGIITRFNMWSRGISKANTLGMKGQPVECIPRFDIVPCLPHCTQPIGCPARLNCIVPPFFCMFCSYRCTQFGPFQERRHLLLNHFCRSLYRSCVEIEVVQLNDRRL